MALRIFAKEYGVLGTLVFALFMVPAMMPAQETHPETVGIPEQENPAPDAPSNTNPTQRTILPKKQQSPEQQMIDQDECFQWAGDQTDWDPYRAYAQLADEGYAVALTRKEWEAGLIFRAYRGAEIGAVAGDMVGESEQGAELGAAIAMASELIHSDYLRDVDNPEAQRAVTRYERNLRKWDGKFSVCLKGKGYRVLPRD